MVEGHSPDKHDVLNSTATGFATSATCKAGALTLFGLWADPSDECNDGPARSSAVR